MTEQRARPRRVARASGGSCRVAPWRSATAARWQQEADGTPRPDFLSQPRQQARNQSQVGGDRLKDKTNTETAGLGKGQFRRNPSCVGPEA